MAVSFRLGNVVCPLARRKEEAFGLLRHTVALGNESKSLHEGRHAVSSGCELLMVVANGVTHSSPRGFLLDDRLSSSRSCAAIAACRKERPGALLLIASSVRSASSVPI